MIFLFCRLLIISCLFFSSVVGLLYSGHENILNGLLIGLSGAALIGLTVT